MGPRVLWIPRRRKPDSHCPACRHHFVGPTLRTRTTLTPRGAVVRSGALLDDRIPISKQTTFRQKVIPRTDAPLRNLQSIQQRSSHRNHERVLTLKALRTEGSIKGRRNFLKASRGIEPCVPVELQMLRAVR